MQNGSSAMSHLTVLPANTWRKTYLTLNTKIVATSKLRYGTIL